MNTQTKVVSRVKVEGIHRWAKCPIEQVAFLRNYHRHIFHISAVKKVNHDDRDVEFIQLSHRVKQYLIDSYWNEKTMCCFFADNSCEMLARQLMDEFDLLQCEVNEDGEGGAIIENTN